MTEAKWLAATKWLPMLTFLRGKASERKLRLLACAAVGPLRNKLDQPAIRQAVDVAERFADGEATLSELDTASDRAGGAAREVTASLGPNDRRVKGIWAARACPYDDAPLAAFTALRYATGAAPHNGWQVPLIRDLFGNPFRPVALHPAWLSPDVLTFAQAAYENKALPAGTLEPARLALLADTLEEAGCEKEEILGHLRGEGPHVRGCWVVDALLGKS